MDGGTPVASRQVLVNRFNSVSGVVSLGVEGHKFKTTCVQDFSQEISLSTEQGIATRLFRTGKGKVMRKRSSTQSDHIYTVGDIHTIIGYKTTFT